MMQVKMNARVFDRLINQYRKNFPGYTLPDDAHVIGKSYQQSGDDFLISSQLQNALLNNRPEYQEFKENNPRFYENPNDRGRAFNAFQKEFLGLNSPAPVGANTIFGGISRSSNPSNLLSSGEMASQIFGQQNRITGEASGFQVPTGLGTGRASGFQISVGPGGKLGGTPRYM